MLLFSIKDIIFIFIVLLIAFVALNISFYLVLKMLGGDDEM